jgi:hypothetical protein
LPPEAALLTSFGEDPSFLVQNFRQCARVTVIRNWDQSEEKPGTRVARNFTFVHLPVLSYCDGIIHAKLMLLRFADCVRVVVSSANLTQFDYTAISQAGWVADFPLMPVVAAAGAPPPPGGGSFAGDLTDFVSLLVGPSDARFWCTGFDTSATTSRLVFSAPEVQTMLTGLPSLVQLTR